MSGQRVTLTIPGDPPPGTNAQHRMHWRAVAKLRGYWRTQAWYAWLAAGKPRFEHPRVTVRFVYRQNRRRDLDNLGVAIKPIIDGLRDGGHAERGAFADDDAASIDLRPIELSVDASRPRVEVVLEEMAQL